MVSNFHKSRVACIARMIVSEEKCLRPRKRENGEAIRTEDVNNKFEERGWSLFYLSIDIFDVISFLDFLFCILPVVYVRNLSLSLLFVEIKAWLF